MKDPRSIHFISPLPIEECVSRLKRIAYSTDRKDYLIIDSITPQEYVVQSFTKVGSGSREKVMDGRLNSNKGEGTRVQMWTVLPMYNLVTSCFILIGGIFFLWLSSAGSENATTWLLVGLGSAAAGGIFVYSAIQNEQARSLMADIQRSLDTGES